MNWCLATSVTTLSNNDFDSGNDIFDNMLFSVKDLMVEHPN